MSHHKCNIDQHLSKPEHVQQNECLVKTEGINIPGIMPLRPQK